MRRFMFSCLMLLMSVSIVCGQTPQHISHIARGMGNAGVLRNSARGPAVFASVNLRKIGGVQFQGEVTNSEIIKSFKKMRLDRRGDVGVIVFTMDSGKEISYEAPYWLVSPAINYSLSNDNAVVSLFGRPTNEEYLKISSYSKKWLHQIDQYEKSIDDYNNCVNLYKNGTKSQKCTEILNKVTDDYLEAQVTEIKGLGDLVGKDLQEYTKYFFFSDVHPALHNTILGFRMLQADSMLIDTSYLEVITLDGQPASFPSEKGIARVSTTELQNSIGQTFYTCSESSAIPVQAWILTDVDTQYKASTTGSKLKIEGMPYYHIWGSGANDETSEIQQCTSAFKNMRGEFSLRAPRTWGATIHLARLSALIRAIKTFNPALTKSLKNIAKNNAFELNFRTPRAWPRNGYEDI